METGISETSARRARIAVEDERELRRVGEYARSCGIARAVADALPPNAPREMIEAITGSCALDHAAVLVFCTDLDAVTGLLRQQGLHPQEPIPSRVVRDRLADRYSIPPEQVAGGHLDVRIIHARSDRDDTLGGEAGIEVFCVPDDALGAAAVRQERLGQHEYHTAVRLTRPSGHRLEDLRRALGRPGGPQPDGGGYNPAHGPDGVTVLYFRAPGRTPMGWPRRLEIITAGQHAETLRRHLLGSVAARRGAGSSGAEDSPDLGIAEPPAAANPERHGQSSDSAEGPGAVGTAGPSTPDGAGDDAEGRRLLQLLTGAWVTQALRAMVVLDLPDHLRIVPLTSDQLAERTGAAPDELHRLLRVLSHPRVSVIAPRGRTWRLTDLGRRLSRTAPGSMRHIAMLYGGPFYASFGALAESIQSGENAFEAAYGQAPWDYLRTHPRDRDIFNRAMAEGAGCVRDVARAVDLSAARTIADIGGGNGELLAHLLDAYPHARGMLLEQPAVIAAARVNLGGRGHLDRVQMFPGDFTASGDLPASADVYILSRVLHDWDDRTCAAILRAVRQAAADDSSLLIIERPLAEDPTDPSLAAWWDLHMLVNNLGGRERTRGQYRHLLEEAGFLVAGERPLPLDMSAIIACPAVPAAGSESGLPAGLSKYAR
ncbi:methyltransferase [Actinomadura sp. NPDC048955]|uniref:methyltransferase n=1 Tax=Actinomadura sp. NPDC048955 TaxID=3158228 RepID=UPI0033EAF5E5